MSESNKIGTYKFVAEPFHVDFNGRLTMGVLGNHLLNCAGFHASDRGFPKSLVLQTICNNAIQFRKLFFESDQFPIF